MPVVSSWPGICGVSSTATVWPFSRPVARLVFTGFMAASLLLAVQLTSMCLRSSSGARVIFKVISRLALALVLGSLMFCITRPIS